MQGPNRTLLNGDSTMNSMRSVRSYLFLSSSKLLICSIIFIMQTTSLVFASNMTIKDIDDLYAKGEYCQAFKLYVQFSEKGNAYAQYCLGYMYQYGQCITKDYKEAMNWYQKAAKNGNGDAQSMIGELYEYGLYSGPMSQDKIESSLRW